MRNRQIVPLQFRDQHTRFCAERGRNVTDAVVVASIVLMEHIEKFGSCKVDALALAVVCHVIDHSRGRVTGDNFARIRVHNYQFSGNASTQKQAMRSFVKGNGRRILSGVCN